ncbi:MAG: sigma 54-interacting transcriptional regulator [Bacteroidales bacterium]|nr:sigma 54-interacting transcriptional regulator [Bacteroidales bacterium]
MTKILIHVPGFNIGNPEMITIYEKVADFARLGEPCIFFGQPGVGKEFLAEYYYQVWKTVKKESKFESVNCGCLFGETAHSELFGHEKGIFTNALAHQGFFEKLNAVHGVLFLDEFADLPQEVQPMLLRAIDTGHKRKARRLGGNTAYPTDQVKVIAATEREKELIRPSLLNRLGFQLHVPGLDERPEDVVHAIPYFLKKILQSRLDRESIFVTIFRFCKEDMERFDDRGNPWNRDASVVKNYSDFIKIISDEILNEIFKHQWPGNFRSLNRAIAYGLVRCQNLETELQLKNSFLKHFREGLSNFAVPVKGKERNAKSLNILIENECPYDDEERTNISKNISEVFPGIKKEKIVKMADFLVRKKDRPFTVQEFYQNVQVTGKRNSQIQLQKLADNKFLQSHTIGNRKHYKINEKLLNINYWIENEKDPLALPVDKSKPVNNVDLLNTIYMAMEVLKGVYISGPERSGKTTWAIHVGNELESRGYKVFYFSVYHENGLNLLVEEINRLLKKEGVETEENGKTGFGETVLATIDKMTGYLENFFSQSQQPVLIIDNEELLNTQEKHEQLDSILTRWKSIFRFIIVGDKMDNRDAYKEFVEVLV